MIPDLSLLWIVFFVLLLAGILDRLLLRPVNRVVAARREAIAGARQLAAESANRAQAAADEFDTRTQAARAELYKQMDERRRQALDRRSAVLARTRESVEQELANAKTTLAAQTDAARAQLQRDADALADSIVERVLGRKAS